MRKRNNLNKLGLASACLLMIISCKREIPAKPESAMATASTSAIVNPNAVFSGSNDKYPVQSEVTSLLAGQIFPGFKDDQGRNAQFNAPTDVATDEVGNIYVADAANNRIRMITGNGLVSTVAGNGDPSILNYPTSLAFGPDGSLYIADQGNNRIRKIKDGALTTVAGTGVAGFADGPGATAKFNAPAGIAVDAAGIIYVADKGNNRIRRISATGIVTQWVGNGVAGFKDAVGANAQLNQPMSIAVGTGGIVYVADAGNNRIRKIYAGTISTLAGGDGALSFPTGVTTDAAGNIFVADAGNNRIRKITPDGAMTNLVGSGYSSYYDSRDTLAAIEPWGLTVDWNGTMYVAERNSELIRTITPMQATITLAGNGQSGYREGKGKTAQFKQPTGIVVDKAGNAYVSDYLDNRIRKIAPDGTTSLFAGSGAWAHVDGVGAAASFMNPSGIAIDATGNVYVYELSGIRKISPSGVVTSIGVGGEWGNLAVDPSGNVFSTDPNSSYIGKTLANSTGTTNTQFARVPDLRYTINGVTYSGRGQSKNIAALSNGMFVSGDIVNEKYKMSYDGSFSDPIPPNLYAPDGAPMNLLLTAVAADYRDAMYYATSRNNIGIFFDFSIDIFVIAGGSSTINQGNSGYADGPNRDARFGWITGMSFGPDKALYIADSTNHCVRKLYPYSY